MKTPSKMVDTTTIYLVIDDFSASTYMYPIHVPVPEAAKKNDQTLKKFIMQTLKDLMKVKAFEWYHDFRNVVYDGFQVRGNRIYPNFST